LSEDNLNSSRREISGKTGDLCTDPHVSHHTDRESNDKEFHEVQDILKKKQKQLKSVGTGNRPNAADPLSDEDIATFYSRGVLGIHSPRALLIIL